MKQIERHTQVNRSPGVGPEFSVQLPGSSSLLRDYFPKGTDLRVIRRRISWRSRANSIADPAELSKTALPQNYSSHY